MQEEFDEKEKNSDKNHHEIEIIVNTREYTVEKGSLSYDEIVKYAYSDYVPSPDFEYTVTYSFIRGNETGSLVEGMLVKLRKGMVFIVTKTIKS